MTELLSIENLKTHIFDQRLPVKAVDGVNLTLQTGECFALVGESGCGKTMLALSIGRLLPPAARIVAGKIRFRARELTTLPEEEIRLLRGGKIAYIFQDPMTSLNPVMSVGEQLIEAVQLHRSLNGTAARDLAVDLLAQVQIDRPPQRIRQYPHQLSGGMRQRVMIAMALAGKPSLLIADEPTTALDVTTQSEILLLLKKLREQMEMSVLLITHDLAAVAPHADRIGVMYAGRIVEVASAREFYRQPSHPYTQALLACIPKTAHGKQPFRSIPGSVPDLRFTPAGCPFHTRCPEVIDRCRHEEPQLKPLGPTHRVSCWRRENPLGSDPRGSDPI